MGKNKRFTTDQIADLMSKGKIRGYVEKAHADKKKREKQPHAIGGRVVTRHYHKDHEAKNYISLNLLMWCNEKCLQLQEEYVFHETRKWRFDWAIPAEKIAVEFEGGIFIKSGNKGHRSAQGIMRDIEKYNAAAAAGWRVVRFGPHNYKNLIQTINLLWQKQTQEK
jgi:hypothetical protein